MQVHRGTPVARIDPEARALTTAAGDRFSYDLCLVATGASTAVPPVPGLAGPGVFVLRSFDDAVRLRGAVMAARLRAGAGAAPRALVLGASFAGVEIASVLRRARLQVSIAEREPGVLPRVAHPACAEAVERHLRARGHDLRLGVSATAVERRDERLLVTLEVGAEAFDLIVVCTGSRPNLALARGDRAYRRRSKRPDRRRGGRRGRTLPQRRARAVRRRRRRTHARPCERRARRRGSVGSSARRQGRTAGLMMAGMSASCPGGAPCNIQHAGELLFAAGGSLATADAVEVEERGESVAVLGFSGARLVGFNLLGDVRRAGPLMSALGRAHEDPAARGCLGAAAALAVVREGMAWTTRNAG